MEKDFLQGSGVMVQGGMASNWKRVGLDEIIGKKIFTVNVVRHWNT